VVYLAGGILGGIAWNFAPHRILFLALVFAMVLPFIFHRTKRVKIDRLIGELSYSVYLAHYPILRAFQTSLAGSSYFGPATAIASILASIVLFILVEHPIDRWRQSRAATAGKVRFAQPRNEPR
jgi:peptidoglycan/LPS O-acetylase OafA/YrhL